MAAKVHEYRLKRAIEGEFATIGALFRSREASAQRVCYTLEDVGREVKVKGETRIPAGRYRLKLRTWGGFHKRYSADKRFAAWHVGMIEICDIPGYSDVLIHCGNTDANTMGCVLTGTGIVLTGRMALTESAKAYEKLYKQIAPLLQAGEEVWLSVEDVG